MKQKFFTLIMMLALVIVTGSAFGQAGSKTAPYRGGTYSYTLGGITLDGNATAVISYSIPADVTITESSIALTSASTSLSFTVEYSATAGSGDLTATITYDAVGGCSNHISWAIAPVARPSLTLSVASPADYCQTHTGTANNIAATTGSSNTIDFTVTPVTSATGYNYDYTLNFTPAVINGASYSLSNPSGGGTLSGNTITGATAASVIRVTFNSSPGASVSLVGTLDATPVLHLSVPQGGGTVNGSITGTPATTTIGSVPVIGTFN